MKINTVSGLTYWELGAVNRKSINRDRGRYRSASEFMNPFFIIMHESQGRGYEKHEIFSKLYPNLFRMYREELEHIKQTYEFISHNQWPPTLILPGTPRGRIILVSGCFDSDCVENQRSSLRKNGFDAHISLEGTFPMIDTDIRNMD